MFYNITEGFVEGQISVYRLIRNFAIILKGRQVPASLLIIITKHTVVHRNGMKLSLALATSQQNICPTSLNDMAYFFSPLEAHKCLYSAN